MDYKTDAQLWQEFVGTFHRDQTDEETALGIEAVEKLMKRAKDRLERS